MNIVDKMKPGKSYVRIEKKKGQNGLPAYDIWVGSFAREKKDGWLARLFPRFSRDGTGSLAFTVYAEEKNGHYLFIKDGCLKDDNKVFGVMDMDGFMDVSRVQKERAKERLYSEAFLIAKEAAQEYKYDLVET